MPLSVASALARLDVDPWQEAAELAGLPGGTATQRFASMISTLPDGSSTYPDSAMIAARLITLLPRPARPRIPAHATLFGAGAPSPPRAVTYVYVIFMVLALGVQWITASHQPPAQVGNVEAPTPSTISPPGTTAKLWPVMINHVEPMGCPLPRGQMPIRCSGISGARTPARMASKAK
jgi:hypothetical protein